MRVLLVEDSPGDTELLRRSLAESSEQCFELTVARSFSAAMACARRGGSDVILLDLGLPDSRGVESVQDLALAVPRIPIVVLTGLDRESAALEALRHGAQDYLVKGESEPRQIVRSLRYAIERKAFEAVLAERAHFDSLTGLVNRSLFHDRLEHALARARRAEKRLALMFVDLDAFKTVNDTLGHEVGDQVLKAVAGVLCGVARECETVARLGGDEFTVVLEQIDARSDAEAVAKRMLAAFEAPLRIPGKQVRVTCSIGIAIFPDSATNCETLLRHADSAMFSAKARGRNGVQVFGDRDTP